MRTVGDSVDGLLHAVIVFDNSIPPPAPVVGVPGDQRLLLTRDPRCVATDGPGTWAGLPMGDYTACHQVGYAAEFAGPLHFRRRQSVGPTPSQEVLAAALASAGAAHHDYESRFLGGDRDAQWSGWYAAYVLGRLDDFTSPTALVTWLESAPSDGEWSQDAASFVLAQIEAC